MNAKIKELIDIRKEIRMARKGKHKALRDQEEEMKMKAERDIDEEEFSFVLQKKRLDELRDRKVKQAEQEMLNKIKIAKEDLLKEIEDAERIAELEYSMGDISKITFLNHDNGKKTLRGRGGGDLIVPPSYLTANQKPATPSLAQSTQFLLTDSEIAADLKYLMVDGDRGSDDKKKSGPPLKRVEVQITRQKLIYDSKSFKQGEEVHVESRTYGKFQARIDQITDTVVILKATQGWDTRQVHASFTDLQERLVQIYKKRNN